MEKIYVVVLLVVLTLVTVGYAVNYYRQQMSNVEKALENRNTLYASVMIIDNYNSTHVLAVVKNTVVLAKPVPVLVNDTWVERTRLQSGDIVLIPKP